MKMPSINKQSIGTFFLYHTEKLILVLCLALFGLFLWMGLKAKPFEGSTPSKLVSSAERADQHVKRADVWEAIKPHRKGRTNVLASIEGFEGAGALKANAYLIDPLSGVPALTRATRKDPGIVTPQNPVARHFRAPLLIASAPNERYSELTSVGDPNFGSGARGFSGGGDEDSGDEYGDEYGDFGGSRDFGGSLDFGGRGGRGGRDKEAEEEDVIPTVDAGSQIQQVHVDSMAGVIPKTHGIGAEKHSAHLVDVVCVSAVLDIQKQFKAFDVLTDSIGYFHERDKPIYQHVEIQRRVNGGKWVDRSEFIQFNLPSKYPAMHNMPKSEHFSAPDNTAPQYYDPALTGPNPPVAFVDYLPHIGHPELTETREFPDIVGDTEEVENPLDFEGGKSPSPSGARGARQSPIRGGNLGRISSPGSRAGRSVRPGATGRSLGRSPGRSPGRSASPGQRGSLGGSSTRGGSTDDEEFLQTRAGSDFTDYMKVLLAKRPEEKYKLVRFFDVVVNGVKSKTTFEYRMRVWVGDPNNEDPDGEFAAIQAGGGGSGTRTSGGGRARGGGDDEYGAEDEEYSPGRRSPGRSPGRSASGQSDENEPQWVEVTSQMTDIEVRRRLKEATASNPDSATGVINYTVSEMRKKKVKGPDGKETITEKFESIPVPTNHPFLRFARPSEWSESVTITVVPDNSQVAVGKIVPPKELKLKVNGVDAAFPAGEPQMEIVASTWSAEYGTAVPTKQTVSRGELLNFHTAAHIVHPITWKVYLTKNPNPAQGEDKFKVPIRTGKVIVDSMGGAEIPLPRAEKMRHSLASEILVMDSWGNLKLSNDMEDRTTYRNLLLQPDESQIVGRPKKRPKKKKRGRDDGDGLSDEF